MSILKTSSLPDAAWKPAEVRVPTPLQTPSQLAAPTTNTSEVREAFDDFVGQTFYGQMLSSMRKTVGKPAYFHGGQAEEVFQSQLDQTLAETLADATADQFTGPMFELFNLPRR
jgi:peptidoglycan hydrolase FlgJ